MSAPEKTPAAVNTDINVRRIHFARSIDIPGRSGTEAIEAKSQMNTARWTIIYQPRIRHHRIEYFPSGARASEVCYVHEAMVALWVPAD